MAHSPLFHPTLAAGGKSYTTYRKGTIMSNPQLWQEIECDEDENLHVQALFDELWEDEECAAEHYNWENIIS